MLNRYDVFMKLSGNRHPEILREDKISLDGNEVNYTLKRSYRARYARLEIRSAGGLIVTIPRRYRLEDVHTFLQQKSRWILKALTRHSLTLPALNREEMASGDTVPYLGRNIKVVVQTGSDKYIQPSMLGDCLLISKPKRDVSSGQLLENWYRHQAATIFKQKAEEISGRLGIRFNRLSIRGQKTRWGSCSRLGTISLNWRLMMVPEPVIDYVIIHELSHIKEMNHSSKFWQLVALHCPEWQEHRRWLRDHLL